MRIGEHISISSPGAEDQPKKIAYSYGPWMGPVMARFKNVQQVQVGDEKRYVVLDEKDTNIKTTLDSIGVKIEKLSKEENDFFSTLKDTDDAIKNSKQFSKKLKIGLSGMAGHLKTAEKLINLIVNENVAGNRQMMLDAFKHSDLGKMIKNGTDIGSQEHGLWALNNSNLIKAITDSKLSLQEKHDAAEILLTPVLLRHFRVS